MFPFGVYWCAAQWSESRGGGAVMLQERASCGRRAPSSGFVAAAGGIVSVVRSLSTLFFAIADLGAPIHAAKIYIIGCKGTTFRSVCQCLIKLFLKHFEKRKIYRFEERKKIIYHEKGAKRERIDGGAWHGCWAMGYGRKSLWQRRLRSCGNVYLCGRNYFLYEIDFT